MDIGTTYQNWRGLDILPKLAFALSKWLISEKVSRTSLPSKQGMACVNKPDKNNASFTSQKYRFY